MSRYKDKLYELEIDAIDMSKEEFIKKHGELYLDIWEDTQRYLKQRENKIMTKTDYAFDSSGHVYTIEIDAEQNND